MTSDRAGGRYAIACSATAEERFKSPKLKAKLTTWIIDRHLAGEEMPLITSAVMNEVERRRLLDASARVERFFLYLLRSGYRLGSSLNLTNNEAGNRTLNRIRAWTECVEEKEAGRLLTLVDELGYVEYRANDTIRLKWSGYQRLEEVARGGVNSRSAFVAMWFDASMDDAYKGGIEPAIRRAGYEPIRIDKKEHSNKIDDEIIADIKRSRFIVADFTCGEIEDKGGGKHELPRGGVYFEAGFAYGMGLPVIWTCKRDHIGLVHFDTNHFAHVLWDTPEELCEALFNRIVHVVGYGPSYSA